jgi:uncharacterized protein YkwD
MAAPCPVGEADGMSRLIPRLASIVLGGLVVASVAAAAPPTTTATTDLSVDAAELYMARLINGDRARHGLRPIRLDSRLMVIARRRSTDMAQRGYFSHTQPDGRNVFDMISAARIRWYSAGEIIAWNTYPELAESSRVANRGWLGSTGHRRIIMSREYNYMGLGLAIADDGKRYWTGVFLRGPDRTGGWVRPAAPSVARASAESRRVSFRWTGGDRRLAVLTAGFHSFQVQRRIDGGAWVTVRSRSTLRSYAVTVGRGRTVELRVRARDRAGNFGTWQLVGANT